ncbi:MAG: peroxiredoxin family protein [Acidimicrobiia bacterium]
MTTPTKRKSSAPARSSRQAGRAAAQRQAAQRRLLVRVAIGVVVALGVLFVISQTGGGSASSASGPRFDVGSPGPGAEAPTFRLPSTDGSTFDLAEAKGESVLLYFQEGIMCQPCWTQITDIESSWGDFEALGIDRMVSITVDDLGRLRQKVADEGIETPLLADPDLSLAEAYTANQYGMMGTGMYGHSFILVGPDGTITWRADYGGAPDYTMYVKPGQLLDDLRAELGRS